MQPFSKRIHSARKHANLTQKALAEAAGISRVTVTQWENGDVEHIRSDNLFAIAKALQVKPEWLALGRGRRTLEPKGNTSKISKKTKPAVEAMRQALPYIHIHQGQTFVVHLPDEVIFSTVFHGIVHDLTLLTSLGIHIILVHGARKTINQALSQKKLATTLTNNLRVTPRSILPFIQQAVGAVKQQVEANFSMGTANTPMSHARVRITSGNLVAAQPIGIINGIDYEMAGKVRRIDNQAIEQYLAQKQLVLLSPVGYSSTGEIYNLSSIELAKIAAEQLQADKLIYIADTTELKTTLSLPAHLTLKQAKTLARKHPLLKLVLHACRNGVHRSHILEQKTDGALLCETLTRDGCGLMVTADPYENIRPARGEDIPGIMDILAPLEMKGILIKRSKECLEQDIQHFHVAEKDGMILGCAALYPYQTEHTAELACLATHPAYQKQGYGNNLLQHIETIAQQAKVKNIFILTTQSMQWFVERGFKSGQPTDLPDDRQALYNWQRNSKILVKPLH